MSLYNISERLDATWKVSQTAFVICVEHIILFCWVSRHVFVCDAIKRSVILTQPVVGRAMAERLFKPHAGVGEGHTSRMSIVRQFGEAAHSRKEEANALCFTVDFGFCYVSMWPMLAASEEEKNPIILSEEKMEGRSWHGISGGDPTPL